MATRVVAKTTFAQYHSIEPFYTGGEIVANKAGTLLASTIDDEDCLLVDSETAKPLVRIDGDGETITSLALTPGADYLIICSRSLSMRIFQLACVNDTITAELVRTVKPHATPVVASTVDETGSLVVTGGADGIVKVWDIRGGYCSHTFSGHGGVITALELFETNAAAALARTNSKKRKIVGTDTNAPTVRALCLASASEDGRIKVHNLNTKQQLATLESHVSVVRALRFDSKRRMLLSASRDKTLVLWDVNSWSPARVLPISEELETAGFLLDGQYVYTGGEQGRLRIWSTKSGVELTTSQRTRTETEMLVSVFPLPDRRLLSVRNNQVLELTSYENLDTDKEQPLQTLRTFSGNYDEVIDMAALTNNMLAIADNTESVKIVSTSTDGDGQIGTNVAILEGHSDVIVCIDVDSSGTWLATGSKDNMARLWHINAARSRYDCVASFAGHTASIAAIGLPKAKSKPGVAPPFMITGSEDKTVKRWDTSKLTVSDDGHVQPVAKALFTRVAHDKDINAIDVSATAPLFASASQDRTIKIWSVEDGSTTAVLRGHKRGVWSVRFSPAGTPALNLAEGGSSGNRGLLISGSGDNTVKVWSMNSYACLLTLEGHQNSVLKVLWLPPPPLKDEDDDRQRQKKSQPMIASASSDTLIKLWSPYASSDTDHLLATLDGHTDRVWSLVAPLNTNDSKFTPLPYTFISGAADAKITFWTDTTETTAEQSSKALTERIEQDQMLQNHILARNYKEVITLALALNHPGRLLKVFEEVVNMPPNEREANTHMNVKAVDEVLANLNQEQVFRLLERVRDWNTNARTATVAQKVLHCLLKSYPREMWVDMAKDRNVLKLARNTRAQGTGGNAMKAVFRALEAYTERHYKRLEELADESYLVEYTLREMDEIAGTSAVATNGVHAEGMDGDVIMV